MTSPERRLEELGAHVRTVEEAELDHLGHAEQVRARLLKPRAPQRSSEAWRLAAFATAGAMIGALVILLVGRQRNAALSFRLDDPSGEEAQLGRPLHPSTVRGATLRFSDGSSVTMQGDTQTRVAAIDSAGARVLLERGRVGVNVVHQVASRWYFEAGPFEVRVTGTKFDLSWDPARNAVELSMAEGSVIVTGCSLSGMGFVAGQSLRARCVKDSTEIQMTNLPAAPDSGRPTQVESAPSEAVNTRSAPPATSATGASPSQSCEPEEDIATTLPEASPEVASVSPFLAWPALAAAGRYREAYDTADHLGFDGECDHAKAADLLALSEAALFAGRADRARSTLLKVRIRFPRSSHAAAAAFRLGRLAFDTQGAYAEARQWFFTYLQEQPGGGFAREATGRLIEVEYRSGNLQGARDMAARYLQAWPTGPHGALARSVIGD